MPTSSFNKISDIKLNDYFNYIKHEIITNDNLNEILDVDEGIENKIRKEIFNVSNIDELIMKIKSKRYSYNRIKRMLLHILSKTKKDYNTKINYIRILGLNQNGKKIIKSIKNSIDVPIITKYKKEYDILFKDDIKASKLYSLITDYDYKEDYKSSIIKETKN